jgi:arabinose-5-phosphate isomerase
MRQSFDVIGKAREVLEIEARGILSLKERLGDEFARAVDILYACEGKVVVTGLGKSGQVGRKIAATLASTGTPAFFLHAAEGLHGDLGMIARNDAILAVSNSGETEEVLKLLPMIKRWGLNLVVITGSVRSTLARAGDVVLNVEVPEEACPLGLSPTTSTTATLAMGDALAVVLLESRGFQQEDFLIRHPGGTLGRRLLLRTSDLMHCGEAIPLVFENTGLQETLLEISAKRLGVTGVTGNAGQLIGVITDGDLRRALTRGDGNILALKAADVMTRDPKTIAGSSLAAEAIAMMEQFSITSLFIVDPEWKKPLGIIHLHDLLKAGIV